MGLLQEVFAHVSTHGGGDRVLRPRGSPPFLFVSVYICVSLGVSPLGCEPAGSRCVSSPAAQAAECFSTAGKFQGQILPQLL